MTAVVLDASALLALLKDEKGANRVARDITQARMTAVNIAEVISHFVHLGMPIDEIDDMLGPLPIEIVDSDLALARSAGHLRAETAAAGLSLGDRFCLALALRDGLPALTADKSWLTIANRINAAVELIR